MASPFYALDSSYHLYPIRGFAGFCHLLHDVAARKAILIDTGLLGEPGQISRMLKNLAMQWNDIEAILLTHGHLDHTGGLAKLKQRTGAPILAHPAEQPHIDGTFPYRGASRLCGAMEAFGRFALRYRTAAIDEPLHDNQELPFWGGLKVIHLPGHTQGHCGFYSARFDLLFSGDLFASYPYSTHIPPPFLNSCAELIDASLERVQQLAPKLVTPNHYWEFDGTLHRRKFDALVARRIEKRRVLKAAEGKP